MTSDVITLARQTQERHSQRKPPYSAEKCNGCVHLWPCPDRVFADVVLRSVEARDTQDQQIREHAGKVAFNTLEDQTLAHAEAILALLGPAATPRSTPTSPDPS